MAASVNTAGTELALLLRVDVGVVRLGVFDAERDDWPRLVRAAKDTNVATTTSTTTVRRR